MLNNLLSLTFVILALSGCGSHPTRAHVTTSAKGVAIDTLRSSVAELEASEGEKFLHTKRDDADINILIEFGAFKDPSILGQCFCVDDQCVITLRYDLDPGLQNYTDEQRWDIERELRGVLIHELGHAFGLRHILPDEGEVMSKYRSRSADNPEAYARFIAALHESRLRFFK